MKLKKAVTLEDCPAGSLFMHKKTLGLKTEYRTTEGCIESYIVGSGEFFWGGTHTAHEQKAVKVRPIKELKITMKKL
jgi:hypothetical protein